MGPGAVRQLRRLWYQPDLGNVRRLRSAQTTRSSLALYR
jgi:hypothetical protein